MQKTSGERREQVAMYVLVPEVVDLDPDLFTCSHVQEHGVAFPVVCGPWSSMNCDNGTAVQHQVGVKEAVASVLLNGEQKYVDAWSGSDEHALVDMETVSFVQVNAVE